MLFLLEIGLAVVLGMHIEDYEYKKLLNMYYWGNNK